MIITLVGCRVDILLWFLSSSLHPVSLHGQLSSLLGYKLAACWHIWLGPWIMRLSALIEETIPNNVCQTVVFKTGPSSHSYQWGEFWKSDVSLCLPGHGTWRSRSFLWLSVAADRAQWTCVTRWKWSSRQLAVCFPPSSKSTDFLSQCIMQ